MLYEHILIILVLLVATTGGCQGNFCAYARKMGRIASIFHELEAFIGQAFKGAAVLGYRKALITPPMGDSSSPAG
jgi:hypothetical protein